MEIHESIYRELKSSGNQGWGGLSFDERMKGWDEQLKKLFDRVELRGKRVLELGSGAGDISIRVAQRGCEVTGVEISPTAVDWAKEKANNLGVTAKFICSSASDQLMLKDEKFDLIIDGNCLHCLFGEDRIGFYNNIERLMTKEGYVFISSAIIGNEEDEIPKISSVDRCFVTREAIVVEIERRGFRLIEEWDSNGTHKHYYGLFQYLKE